MPFISILGSNRGRFRVRSPGYTSVTWRNLASTDERRNLGKVDSLVYHKWKLDQIQIVLYGGLRRRAAASSTDGNYTESLHAARHLNRRHDRRSPKLGTYSILQIYLRYYHYFAKIIDSVDRWSMEGVGPTIVSRAHY